MTDLNNEINVPQPGSPRFESDVAKAIGRIRFALGPEGNPAHESLALLGLTASKLIGSDADKTLASVDLIDFAAGTANEIAVADDGSGGITIGLVDPLIVGKGGTGLATLTDHGILLGSGTGAITPLAAASNGQLPIGSTGADPVLATLTGTADQIAVTNGAGSITLATPQDIAVTSDVEFQSLLVDQNTDAIGLNIDSEATTDTNYGINVVTGAGAGCCYMAYGDGNNGCCYLGLGNNHSYSANFIFLRNLTAASTDSAVVAMIQDHADDTQPTLYLKNDGSGPALYIESGSLTIAEGVTISTGMTVPDDGYIGSVTTPQAIQIEGDGDVVFAGAIDVPSDIVCGGHVLFDLDNGHIGYYDNSPILTFNNADDRTEVTGDLNLTGATALRLVATDASRNLVSSDLVNWVAGTANQITVTDDSDGTITLSTPQDLHTGASPTLTGLTLSGLTAGSVVFAGASGVISQDNSNLFWDDTNNRLGIGTTSPAYYDLEISGSGDGVGVSAINSTYGSATLAARYGGYFVDFYNNSASGGVSFRSRRSRGTSGTPLTCQDGDFIGEFTFHQYDGSDFEQLGGFLYVASDVSDNKGQTIFYYYDGVAKYIASFDKDETKLGDVDGTDYVQISSTTGNLTFQGGSGFYPRVLNQSAEPAAGTGATQCDTGEAVIWTDTDDSKCYLCYNHGGTVKTVEMA